MSNTISAPNTAIATTSVSSTNNAAPMSARGLVSANADQALGKSTQGAPGPVVANSEYEKFHGIYEKDFANWNAASGSKGYLDSKDVDLLMQNPKYKGEDAAALAAMKKLCVGVTHRNGAQAIFRPTEMHLNNTDKTVDQVNPKVMGDTFEGCEKRINNSSTQMFAHGSPDGRALMQGDAGDCFLDAPLSSLASARPEDVRKMIHDNGDGSSTVSFAGQPNKPVKVQNATDAEVACYTSSGKDGRWATTIEKAYAKLTHGADKNGSSEFIDRLVKGDASVSSEDLTGHQAPNVAVNANLEEIKTALAQHKVVTLATQDNTANGLPTGHSMTVEGYDSKTGSFLIRNPWGSYGVKHDAYPSDGKAFGKGMMEIPADKLENDFQAVCIEQNN